MNKIILLFLLLLTGCGDLIITQPNSDETMSITSYKVDEIESAYSTVLCIYHCKTGMDYWNYKDKISFADTIGKYKIGDSVRAEFIKQ